MVDVLPGAVDLLLVVEPSGLLAFEKALNIAPFLLKLILFFVVSHVVIRLNEADNDQPQIILRNPETACKNQREAQMMPTFATE